MRNEVPAIRLTDTPVPHPKPSLQRNQAETIFRQAKACGISCASCKYGHRSRCDMGGGKDDYFCNDWEQS